MSRGTESARARAEELGWNLSDCLVLTEGRTDKDDDVVVALFPDRIAAHKPRSLTQVSGAVEGGQVIPISGIEGATADKDGELTRLGVRAAGNTYSFWLPDGDAASIHTELSRLIGSAAATEPSADLADPPPPTGGFPTF